MDTVSLSNTKVAEYRAISTTSKDVHSRRLLYDFDVHIQSPTPLFANNIISIKIANNLVIQEETKHKHIKVQTHFVR